MKKAIVFGALLISLLFTSIPVFATIQVSLENPANGTSASGVTIISGWVFSDTDAPVTIWLRVNGKTTETQVLCCGPRQDVKDAHPAAPLNSSFVLLYNYGVLPSGVHTIGVEVTAEGEEPMIAESSVTVVRPADAEFLTSLSVDNAKAERKDDGTIVITGAEATPKDSDMSVTTDLTLSYHVSRQGFGIDMAQDILDPESPYDAAELLEDVAHAIFATYDALNMATRDPEASEGRTVDVSTLDAAVHSFVGTSAGSQAAAVELLPAIQTAWRNTRVPWEQSEAFLFGPVSDDEHDPFLDTWPVNTIDIEEAIKRGQPFGNILADNDAIQGFHTLEYLLFRDANGSTDPAAIVAGFSASESRRNYARAVVGAFASHTQQLRNSWDPGKDGGDFVHELALAGRGSATYTDQKSAVQELVNGMIGIADELGNVKMGVPLNDQSTAEEESRFSNNSRRDFIDNLRSINNIYEGRFDQTDGTSMGVTDFVVNQDPALDARVRMAIRDAMAAVIAIPEPFGQSIMSHRATVQKAVEAAQHLQAMLEEILDVVQAASFAH